MVLLSRPVFSSWNLFNSNSFPNFKILHVATKSSSWNPFGPSNDAAQEFKDKANESMTKFDATSKMIKEFVETVTKKLISLFNYPATWIVTLSCFGLFLFFYPKGKLIALDAISWIPRTISYSRITDSTAGNNYVERKDLEDQLERAFTRIPDGRYSIVYGNKGVGKTELVTHVAIYDKNKTPSIYDKFISYSNFIFNPKYAYRYGVVRIEVTSIQNIEAVFSDLLSKLHVRFLFLNVTELVSQIEKVYNRSGVYPTIIFDVERGEQDKPTGILNGVRSLVKHLATVCRCIIVLSEANSVLELGGDSSRENFILIGELSENEAKDYLVKRDCKVPDVKLNSDEDLSKYVFPKIEESNSQVNNSTESNSNSNSTVEMEVDGMDFVFKNVGTKPADLVNLVKVVNAAKAVSNDNPVKDFVDYILTQATKHLVAFPLQTILQALKDHPDGVNPEYFNNLKEEGVDLTNPVAVGKIMKEKLNPLIYHQYLKQYQLISTAHKTALKSYKPINPLPIPT
mmetsp:Transcript_7354/g.7758  ORF Transcript_7354/g.7758 Transcript_7354/m.7758 type:complete len:513 (-) Transcript_7354:141-1679(-)